MKRSKLAISQLSRGSNISKKSSPVLESFFNDDDMFNTPKLTGTYANPQTAISNGPSEVRGLTGLYLTKLFEYYLFKDSRVSFSQTDMFHIAYIPPWHPAAIGRSTRPAVSVCYKQNIAFNGLDFEKFKPKPIKTLNIFDSAVWRYKTKFVYKRLFMNAWNGLKSKSKKGPRDGLYVITAKRFPTKEEQSETQAKLSKFLYWIATKTDEFDWAQSERNLVSSTELAALNRKPPQTYTPQQWNWGHIK